MGQNSCFKMIELLVNAVELSVNSVKFHFFERLLFLSHVMIRPNFSEFHQFFLNFSKIDGISHLQFFLLRTNFQTLQECWHCLRAILATQLTILLDESIS
jgi:hypothetical protein